MTDEAFSEDDAKFSRQERFKARREMINTMKRMGVRPKSEPFITPKGAINASKLKEMYKDPNTEKCQKFIVTGKPVLDYFEERHISKLSRHEPPKKRTKK